MIETSRFSLTKKDFFQLLLHRYLKKRWWLLLWIIVLAILVNIMEDDFDSFTLFITVFAVIYPLLLFWKLSQYTNSKDNKLFYLERYAHISTEEIVVFLDDDTSSTMKLGHFIKTERIKNYHLLFLAKDNFIFIPEVAFKTNQDKIWFENEILKKIKGR